MLGPELSKRDAVIAKLQEALKEKGDQLAKQDQQLLDLSTRKAAEVGVLEKALGDLRGVAEQQAGEGWVWEGREEEGGPRRKDR